MPSSAGKQIKHVYAKRGSGNGLPLFCILLCAFLCNRPNIAFAQLPEVDVQNNRLFEDDEAATHWGNPNENLNGWLLQYLPKFTMQKVMLSNKGLSWPIYGQKNRSFTWGNGNWGYNDHGIITYYNNKYQNTGIYNAGSTSQIHLLQALKDTTSPNCFYLVFANMFNSSILYLQHICIDKNNEITFSDLDKEYLGILDRSTAINSNSGFMARGNNGKSAYFYELKCTDSSLYVYELRNKHLAKTGSFYLPAFLSVRNAMSLSANSKKLRTLQGIIFIYISLMMVISLIPYPIPYALIHTILHRKQMVVYLFNMYNCRLPAGICM